MIKRIKTDNINVDIMINTINKLKSENEKLSRENAYLKLEIKNIREITLPIILHRLDYTQNETLFKNCGYSPEKIGAELLRKSGYKVHIPVYSNNEPTVYDKNGKIVF